MKKFIVGTLPLLTLLVFELKFPETIHTKNFGLLLILFYSFCLLSLMLLVSSLKITKGNPVYKNEWVLKSATDFVLAPKNYFFKQVNSGLCVFLFLSGQKLVAISYFSLLLLSIIVKDRALKYIEAYKPEEVS